MPPERSRGKLRSKPTRPTSSRIACARRWASATGTPSNSSGSVTLAMVLRQGSRFRRWKTKPISRRGAASVSPSKITRPLVGRSRPPTRRNSVLLPQPDGPTILTNSCGRTSNDTSWSARSGRSRSGKSAVTCSTMSSGAASGRAEARRTRLGDEGIAEGIAHIQRLGQLAHAAQGGIGVAPGFLVAPTQARRLPKCDRAAQDFHLNLTRDRVEAAEPLHELRAYTESLLRVGGRIPHAGQCSSHHCAHQFRLFAQRGLVGDEAVGRQVCVVGDIEYVDGHAAGVQFDRLIGGVAHYGLGLIGGQRSNLIEADHL